MALYNVFFHRDFEKEIKKIPKKDVLRILDAIAGLARNPFPSGAKKLSGSDAHRIRIGTYRVVYRVEGGELIVYVLKVAHRKDVYR